MLIKLGGYGCALLLAAGICGCQTWAPGAFPMQNPSRVPPPGTGTYQLPSGYYNSTSASNPSGSGMTASSAGSGLRKVEGGLPTTDLAAAPQISKEASSNEASSNEVQPAQFTAPAARSSADSLPRAQSAAPVASAQFTSGAESGWSSAGYQAGQYETRPIESGPPTPSSSSGDMSGQPDAANSPWQP